MPPKPQPHYEEARRQWYIYHNYKKKFLCTGTKGDWLKAAKAAEQKLGLRIQTGTPLNVAEAVEQWLLRSGSAWNRERLTPFNKYSGAVLLSSVHEDSLIDYLAWLRRTGYERTYKPKGKPAWTRRFKYSAKTLRTMIGMAMQVLRWAADPPRRWVPVLPNRPKDLAPPKKGYHDIPKAKLLKVFERLKTAKRAAPLLRFILEQGCRPAEACLLRWDQIDFEAGIARLERHKTEKSTGEDRVIYLTPAGMDILKTQPPNDTPYVFLSRKGKPYNPKSLRSFMRLRGVPRAYDLRHTFAQNALEQGVRLDVIQKHLGHKRISTTQIYASVRDHQAAEAARGLVSPLQPPPVSTSIPGNVDASGSAPDTQATHEPTQQTRSTARAHRKAGRRGASRRRSA